MAFSSYEEVIEYLYADLPMYQRVGAVAYKEDLSNTIALCEALDHPEKKFKSVHVAGTNGKGSTSHMIAAILQSAGYRTGLYTSPHLKEFTERIKINGQEIAKDFILDFVNRIRPAIDRIEPSFFEITVAMAYDYFVDAQVDIAVIEVGLGGRLDSTNVITPLVSVITSIGLDHQGILGDTVQKIAFEKAGIIKQGVPAVISLTQPEVKDVFERKADETSSPIYFADNYYNAELRDGWLNISSESRQLKIERFPLRGLYQRKNIPGVMMCIEELRKVGFPISNEAIVEGLSQVVALTGLRGRWQVLGEKPMVVCDTAHNVDGIEEVMAQVLATRFNRLFMIIGMVKDKDVGAVLSLMPKEATYFFCEAPIPRALDAEILAREATTWGLRGTVVRDVNEAIRKAKERAGPDDFIFVGGSTFVVAEVDGL